MPGGAELIELDIANSEELRSVVNDIDIIFHPAAQPSTRRSIEDPHSDFSYNVTGTFNLLSVVAEKKVKRFIFTSSSAVYGEPKQLPMKEPNFPEPITPSVQAS